MTSEKPHQGMLSPRSCGNCVFAIPYNDLVVKCIKNAPRPAAAPDGSSDVHYTSWPLTLKTDVCYEWGAKRSIA